MNIFNFFQNVCPQPVSKTITHLLKVDDFFCNWILYLLINAVYNFKSIFIVPRSVYTDMTRLTKFLTFLFVCLYLFGFSYFSLISSFFFISLILVWFLFIFSKVKMQIWLEKKNSITLMKGEENEQCFFVNSDDKSPCKVHIYNGFTWRTWCAQSLL